MTTELGKVSKKDKKAKKRATLDGAVEKVKKQQPDAATETSDAAELSKAERKAAKAARKAAKAAKKAAKAAAGAASGPSSAALSSIAPSAAAPTSSDSDGETAIKDAHERPAKKQKREKKAAAGTSASLGSGAQAAVGDKQLAASLPKIVKQLYTQPAELAGMDPAKLDALRAERATAVEGAAAHLAPLTAFSQTGLPPAMLHATRDFVSPSPIQAQCWPIILSGHDLIGIAATGSGKTLGFGLPMLRHVAAQREAGVVKGKGPFALVMAPTRELACQIAEVLEESGSKCGVKCLCVYGGVPKPPQVKTLKAGVEVVVGTPGRMEDLMNDGVLKLNEVTYLVLDEADRMLDLGFEPHIRAICSTVRADRQTLMFSATWPTAVQKLAANFLAEPVKVTIGSQDLAASHSVTQVVEVLELHQRDDRLLALLNKYHKSRSNRIIIFVLYKKEAPRVEALLKRKGWAAAAVHGDASQASRTAAVDAFRAGTTPLLIATDVAARGLDIPDVEVVINYSFPLTIEDYVHRIGRTGRAGKTGLAHTFFCAAQDKQRAGELINVLREAGQTVPEELLKFGTTVKKKEHKLYGSHFKDVDFNAKATKITFDD